METLLDLEYDQYHFIKLISSNQNSVEEHPLQKQEIVRDRMQNAARRTLLKTNNED